jgi:hypothetical protein
VTGAPQRAIRVRQRTANCGHMRNLMVSQEHGLWVEQPQIFPAQKPGNLVVRGRIEPPTFRFSVTAST